MTYEKVVQEIIKKGKFGLEPGFKTVARWLDILGPIDQGLQILHIAGSNGKGSTAAMVSSILAVLGYKVGLFTSPHLKEFTERIQIVEGQDAKPRQIERDALARIGTVYLEDDRLPKGNMLDYTLLIALKYFQEQQVDYVVLETGLGGRLDSTNGLTVVPKVCGITSISLEHTAILGDTIEEIAREKAGIIKSGCSAVIGYMPEPAAAVIRQVCETNQVPYVQIGEREIAACGGVQEVLGYQNYNEACAKAMVKMLLKDQILEGSLSKEFLEAGILKGVKATYWPGRLEVLQQYDPWFLVDGAHNVEGVKALEKSLADAFPGEKVLCIMGVLQDREYGAMIETMAPIASGFLTVTPKDPRALPKEVLAKEIEARCGLPARPMSVKEAVQVALCEGSKRVVAFGSLYFIGEVKDEISIQR